jgi:hypothetical protein
VAWLGEGPSLKPRGLVSPDATILRFVAEIGSHFMMMRNKRQPTPGMYMAVQGSPRGIIPPLSRVSMKPLDENRLIAKGFRYCRTGRKGLIVHWLRAMVGLLLGVRMTL